MTTSQPRHPAFLSLQGGINFRDLGGQRAADGRRVRSGKLAAQVAKIDAALQG